MVGSGQSDVGVVALGVDAESGKAIALGGEVLVLVGASSTWHGPPSPENSFVSRLRPRHRAQASGVGLADTGATRSEDRARGCSFIGRRADTSNFGMIEFDVTATREA